MRNFKLCLSAFILLLFISCSENDNSQQIQIPELIAEETNTSQIDYSGYTSIPISSVAHEIHDATLIYNFTSIDKDIIELSLVEGKDLYTLKYNRSDGSNNLFYNDNKVINKDEYQLHQKQFEFLISKLDFGPNQERLETRDLLCPKNTIKKSVTGQKAFSLALAQASAESALQDLMGMYNCGPSGQCGPIICVMGSEESVEVIVINTPEETFIFYRVTLEVCLGCCWIC